MVQYLADIGVVEAEAEEIKIEGLTLDELIERVERTLKILDGIDSTKFASKEDNEIKINLGNFSVSRSALDYAHQISGPSL